MACYLLALYLAQVKGTRYGEEIAQVLDQLESMPDHIQSVLDKDEAIYALARQHVDTGRCCSWAGTPATRSPSRAR